MTHSTNQGLGRQSALTRRSFVAGASVLAAGMLLGGPFGCSAPAEEGAADTSIEAEAQATDKAADLVFKNGHVQTLVNEGDVAQAVAVRGGTVIRLLPEGQTVALALQQIEFSDVVRQVSHLIF